LVPVKGHDSYMESNNPTLEKEAVHELHKHREEEQRAKSSRQPQLEIYKEEHEVGPKYDVAGAEVELTGVGHHVAAVIRWIIESLLMNVIELLSLVSTLAHHNAEQDGSDERKDDAPRLYLAYY